MMKQTLSKQQGDAILKLLNELVDEGQWEASGFLRIIGQKLEVIRNDFSTKINVINRDSPLVMPNLANRVAKRTGQQEVFIALYSSDGANLMSWERIVINLPKQVISRPIYATEEAVNQIIRSKEKRMNEAYVSMYINQTDILMMGDKTPLDKLGQPLLTIKNNALSLNNINQFVHSSGLYRYEHGHLVKETSIED